MAIQFKRGTAAQWSSNNPILEAGQPGVETDTGLEKIGDGQKHWNDLAYTNYMSPVGTFPMTIHFVDGITLPGWQITSNATNGLTIKKV